MERLSLAASAVLSSAHLVVPAVVAELPQFAIAPVGTARARQLQREWARHAGAGEFRNRHGNRRR